MGYTKFYFFNCVTVEVGVLGSPSLIVSVDVKCKNCVKVEVGVKFKLCKS